MRKRLAQFFLFLVLFFTSTLSFAQLDSEHYLPPLKQVSNNAAIKQQAIYLSTPETDPINKQKHINDIMNWLDQIQRLDFNKKGNKFSKELYFKLLFEQPITDDTNVQYITGLEKGSSKVYNLADGDNNITLVTNANTGYILTNSGLRFVSPSGKKFYVNYRGRSSAQAGSLVSKGKQALGTDFRWGGIPNRANNISGVIGVSYHTASGKWQARISNNKKNSIKMSCLF